MDVIADNMEYVGEGIALVAILAVGIGLSVRILYLAGVISFKFTNRGIGK